MVDPLVGQRLQEPRDREPAGVARRVPGRQHVVGARRALVRERHGRARAEEDRAVVAQPRVVPGVVLGGLHLEVLGGELVADRRRRVAVAGDDDRAVVAPRGAGDLRGRELLELPGDLGAHRPPEVLGGRDQRDGRGRPVLGLAEQVGGDELGVGGVVGDASRSPTGRRAGRCRRARRAGAWPRRRTRCPRRRSCRPARSRRARTPSPRAPARRRGRRRGRRRRCAAAKTTRGVNGAVALRRRARDDGLDARDLRHQHGHERRRQQREAAGRQVRADALRPARAGGPR